MRLILFGVVSFGKNMENGSFSGPLRPDWGLQGKVYHARYVRKDQSIGIIFVM